jgi:hypothetical protein
MFESQIEEILKKEPTFIGCLARDELPTKITYPCCFVLNTEPRKKPGEHWLAINYNDVGFCYFFDSYGQPPSIYNLDSYIKATSKKYTWNQKRIQGQSSYCGYYAVLFLLFLKSGKLTEFFSKFTNNLSKNDQFITNEIKSVSSAQ